MWARTMRAQSHIAFFIMKTQSNKSFLSLIGKVKDELFAGIKVH